MKEVIYNFIFIITVCIMISLSGTFVYAQGETLQEDNVEEQVQETANVDEENPVYETESQKDKSSQSEEQEQEVESRVTDKSIDTDHIIDDVKEKGKEGVETGKNAVSKAGEAAEDVIDESVYRFWETFFGIHDSIKAAMPFILITSVSLGTVIAVMSRKNKGLKRWAIIAFCIVVPILNLLVVYGMPYIYLIFYKDATYPVKYQITTSNENVSLLFYDLTVRGENGMADVSAGNAIESYIYNFWNGYGIHGVMKIIMPLTLVSSFTLGVVIALLTHENKRLSRWSIIAFCVVIPLINFIIVDGVPFLQHVFS